MLAESKPCLECGALIHRNMCSKNDRYEAKWARRRFCSRECASLGANKLRWKDRVRPVETKVCVGCGETYHRDGQRSDWEWNRRTYCSARCAQRGAAAKGMRKALEASSARHAEHRAYVIGELEFLIGTDTTESLAVRLGYKKGIPSLYRALERWEREDLIARLERYREWEGAA